MERKAESDFGGLLWDNMMYIILLVVFLAAMLAFIQNQRSAAVVWEDFYAKEMARLLDNSQPGDVVSLDVHRATEIAQKNGIEDYRRIFTFDAVNRRTCAQLSPGSKTCFYYFKDVIVVNDTMRMGVPGNILDFTVVAPTRTGVSNAA